MKAVLSVGGWLVAGFFIVGAMLDNRLNSEKIATLTSERDAERGEREIWQARFAEESVRRRADSIALADALTATVTPVNITDTIEVRRFFTRVDTLKAECQRCMASASALNEAGDGLSQAATREAKASDNLVTALARPRRFGGAIDGARDVLRGDLRGSLDGEARIYRSLYAFGRAEHTISRDSSYSRLWYGGRWKF